MALVQAIVGHASPAMTRHYTHLGVESLRKAVEVLPSSPSAPALLLPAASTAEDRLALAAGIAEGLRAELRAVLK